MSDLRPESRALLRAARESFDARDSERARVDRALSARLGLATGALAGPALSTTTSAAASSATAGAGAPSAVAGAAKAGMVVAKWFGVALVIGAVGSVSEPVMRAEPAASHGPTAVGAPSAASTKETGAVEVASTGVASAPSDPSVQPPILAPAAHGPVPAVSERATIGAEARLLRSADEALRSGDSGRALVLLHQHARMYPRSVLAEERSSELVATLCALGRVDEASAEVAHFLRTNPGSPLAASVRSSCGGRHADQAR
jgi:TolA-binding protein